MPKGDERPVVAKVRHGRSTLDLRAGHELDFGRASERTIRLGAEPPDDGVSRTAGRIAGLADGVLIWNDSGSRDLHLRPRFGPSRTVQPGEGRTAQPYRWLDIVLPGRLGDHVVELILLDRPAGPPARSARGAATAYARDIAAGLSPNQRLLLAALCRPLLTRRGSDAVPATYKQVAADVGLSQGTVRNALSEIRQRLHGAGLPTLIGDPSQAEVGTDFRGAVADWALRAGAFDQSHLDEIARRRGDPCDDDE